MKDNQKELALVRQVEGMSLEGMAEHFLKSGYFREVSDPSKAIVKIMAGREVGIPPIASMMGLYIVEGKVTYSATMVGALIKRAGYSWTVQWTDDNGGTCILNFRDAKGENLGVSSFSMADAKAAGLAGKNTWAKYAKAMLFARALTQGGRWFCPEVFAGGCYTPEEIDPQIPVTEDGEVIDATPAATVTVVDPLVAVREKMVTAFQKQGVSEKTLEEFCGCPMNELTADNIETLKGIFAEVRAGKRDAALLIKGMEPPAETPPSPDDLGAGQSQFEKPPPQPPAPVLSPGKSAEGWPTAPAPKSPTAHLSDKELQAHLDRQRKLLGAHTYDAKVAILNDTLQVAGKTLELREHMEAVAEMLRAK